MAFKMTAAADSWFQALSGARGAFRNKFDLYYFCLMLGLKNAKRDELVNGKEFIDYFIADYHQHGRSIVSAVVLVEAKRLGVPLTNRHQIQDLLRLFLNPAHVTGLSENGFRACNGYANHGFNCLNDVFADKPRDSEVFVIKYLQQF